MDDAKHQIHDFFVFRRPPAFNAGNSNKRYVEFTHEDHIAGCGSGGLTKQNRMTLFVSAVPRNSVLLSQTIATNNALFSDRLTLNVHETDGTAKGVTSAIMSNKSDGHGKHRLSQV